MIRQEPEQCRPPSDPLDRAFATVVNAIPYAPLKRVFAELALVEDCAMLGREFFRLITDAVTDDEDAFADLPLSWVARMDELIRAFPSHLWQRSDTYQEEGTPGGDSSAGRPETDIALRKPTGEKDSSGQPPESSPAS